MRRLLFVLVTCAVFFGVTAAFAAEPDEVAAEIADDGVFVEAGASTTDAEIGALVREARNDGENLSIVVLSDEPVSGAVTFADAVVDRAGTVLVVVIAPESVGYAGTGDVYTVDDLETALDVAFERGGDDGDFARSIVESLTGRSVDVADPVPAGSSDGGGSGFVVFLVIAVVVVGGVLWVRSRSKKREAEAATSRIDAAKAEVQRRIDDVANDLLEMEDEVRVADNPRADRFYNEAGDTYRAVSDAYPAATTPVELIDLSNRLDVAIWQLDTAEAILDGTDLPERPEPRRLEPERAPERTIDTSHLPAPPSYERRPSRRSSYGAGSSMMDTLLQLGLTYAAGRRSSPSRRPSSGGGGLGGLFGGLGGRSGASRSGGSTRSSSRRGTGSRVRGGRSRRKR